MEEVRTLFREYAEATGACECFLGFAKEVAALPGQYAPPAGRLLIAEADSKLVGRVALRKLEGDICEMKRLYVRPDFRTRRFGRHLAESIIAEARRMGYRAMRLDTLPSMAAARALYRSLGFQSIPPYNDNPVAGALYLELKL
jgi:ribosomal protein S18 acetylase RimI-like enzyme